MKEISTKIGTIVLLASAFLAGAVVIFFSRSLSWPSFSFSVDPSFPPSVQKVPKDIESFSSPEEFKSYLQESSMLSYSWLGLGGARVSGVEETKDVGMEAETVTQAPERFSETTVQVGGIDEPDILKTDGERIYFSSGESYYWRMGIEIMPVPPRQGITKVIDAFPPEDLEVLAEINKRGDLLLFQNRLIVFSGDTIYGYDISNPESPEKKWTTELKNNSYLVGARLYQNKIYLVTKSQITTYSSCPIRPLIVKGEELEIACSDIYHPLTRVPVDIIYNAVVLDPLSGNAEQKVSFVGSSGSSVFYMSRNSIYLTYSYYQSMVEVFLDFFSEKCRDIIPTWVIDRLNQLQGYEISEAAKRTEFQIILESYYNSLDEDEGLRIRNELQNRVTDYYKEHQREIEITGIVKIGLDNLDIQASGQVPGRPLNQFSLDEYGGHLRIATTVGEGGLWWGLGIGVSGESANDVYVLNESLQLTGSLQGLGLEERIYAVRFLRDKGYIVTFKQIDPFFVLDLSNPEEPEMKGSLKIPGYSSYLYPLEEDLVLGIGKEGPQVKISIFDVSSAQNPQESDKYILQEYWSDVLSTHHAFLLDKKHQIFFLPGSRGAYVFSYQGRKLSLIKAISAVRARRALYLDDYLYIVGDQELVVLDELDWQKIKEVEL